MLTAQAEPGILRRVVVRTVVTVAIASVAVLALATAADALTEVQFKGTERALKKACTAGGGVIFRGHSTGCLLGGVTVFCNDKNKGKNCHGTSARKDVASLVNEIRAIGGRSVSKPSDSSKGWTQKVSVAGLKDVVCPGLRGDFFASSDGTAGVCWTPTATVGCNDKQRGDNCTGFADTKKHAVSTRKRIRALLKAGSVGRPSRTPNGGSTTTTTTGGSTTTTTTGGSTTTTTGGSTTTVPYRP